MVTMKWLLLAFACLPGSGILLAADAAKDLIRETRTEHVDFASGGTIRINNSNGDLNVQGWDKPEVEITLIKSTKRLYTAKESDEAKKRLNLIAMTVDHKTPSQLTISTAFPHRTLHRLNRGRSDLILEYQIHVPRDSHLIVHHGMGDVVVTGVGGDIEATASSGDVVVLLPGSEGYSIDARSKFGDVESDFGGTDTTHKIVTHQLAFAPPSPKHKIFLRVGIGTINIMAMPPASAK